MKQWVLYKINRGQYNLIDNHGNGFFQYPVSKWDAEQERQAIEIFEKMIIDEGILRQVQKFVRLQGWAQNQYGGNDQIIRNYVRTLCHKDMRDMVRRPVLFYHYLITEHEKNQAVRETSLTNTNNMENQKFNLDEHLETAHSLVHDISFNIGQGNTDEAKNLLKELDMMLHDTIQSKSLTDEA